MKKFLMVFLGLALVTFFVGISSHLVVANKDNCVTIQDGILTYSAGHYFAGQPLQLGFDPFGYNYQAHLFNGYFANVYLGRDGFPPYEGDTEAYLAANPGAASKWYWPYRDVIVVMKWNDAWLSNKDCGTQIDQDQYTDPYTPDGILDRHYPHNSYIGSGAWETNHQYGTYEMDGKECHWTYFVKIIAVPEDAYLGAPYDIYGNGTWYTADGTEIGAQIWGSFATIESIYNDPCGGYHGVEYLSPAGPGFGKW